MREFRLEKDFLNIIRKISLFALFLCVISFVTSGCGGDNTLNESDLQPINSSQESVFDEKAADMMAKDGGATAVIDIDSETADTTDKMAQLAIEDYGRANPFLPPNEAIELTRSVSTLPYELVNPPSDPTVDSDASRIVQTKVSGILFDEHNPAAILNMEGTDYLVRTGDVINNYKVLAIYKNNVAVQLGENIYKAGVGELLATNKINQNIVPNLENRFGGSKVKMDIEK